MTQPTRRRLLVSSGTIGLVSIAGCGDPVHETDPPEEEEEADDGTEFDPNGDDEDDT